MAELLKLNGVRKYVEKLSNEEKEHFSRHLCKYVNIYQNDCRFEVTTTNRYTIDTAEASITARKPIRRGDPVKYLVGVQVPITKDEEKDLDLIRRDFSIVMSSRKRLPSLFLGPARFANHDCKANARLTTKGPNGMAVVAVKDIKQNEEIVVSYGDDYFGVGNKECLCHTCETLLQNGWDPKASHKDEDDHEGDGKEDQAQPGAQESSPRGRRGREPETTSRAETPDSQGSAGRKRKRDNESSSSTPRAESRIEEIRTSSFKHSPSNLRQEIRPDDEEEPEVTSKLDLTSNVHASERSGSPSSIFEGGQNVSEGSTSATSVSDAQVEPQSKIATIGDDEVTTASLWAMPLPPRPSKGSQSVADSPNLSQMSSPGSESELSDLDDTMAVDDKSKRVVARKLPHRLTRARGIGADPRLRSSSSSPVVVDPNQYADPNARRPGDYTLTRRLLGAPYSRWYQCHMCKNYFVQMNGIQTNWGCPRCERHCKVYGYKWPKTEQDPKDEDDIEERILDHREIVRTVHREEEKTIKKGKKTTELLAQAEARKRLNGGYESDEEVSFGRNPNTIYHVESDDEGPPQRRKSDGKRKPQKRDFNPDGTLRKKRQYNWSGKFVGRWTKTHPKCDHSKFWGTHPATYTAKQAAGNGGARRIKKTKEGFVVAKRKYVKSGKYAGKAQRQLEKKIARGEVPAHQANVYESHELPYNLSKGKPKSAPKPDPPKLEKKKQKWKGWDVVDQNGNTILNPENLPNYVPRAHPEVKDKTRFDIKPEHIGREKPQKRRRSAPATENTASNPGTDETPKFVAPRRAKGWVYLDANGQPLPEPPRAVRKSPTLPTEPPSTAQAQTFADSEAEAEEDEEDQHARKPANRRKSAPAGRSLRPRSEVSEQVNERPRRRSAAATNYGAAAADSDDDDDKNAESDFEGEPQRKRGRYARKENSVGRKGRKASPVKAGTVARPAAREENADSTPDSWTTNSSSGDPETNSEDSMPDIKQEEMTDSDVSSSDSSSDSDSSRSSSEVSDRGRRNVGLQASKSRKSRAADEERTEWTDVVSRFGKRYARRQGQG